MGIPSNIMPCIAHGCGALAERLKATGAIILAADMWKTPRLLPLQLKGKWLVVVIKMWLDRAARRLGKSYVWHLCSVEIKQKENCQCSVHVEKVRDDLI